MTRKQLLTLWLVLFVVSLVLLIFWAEKDLVSAVIFGSLTFLWTIAGVLSLILALRILSNNTELLVTLLVFINAMLGVFVCLRFPTVYSGVNFLYWLVSGVLISWTISWTISRISKRNN